MSAQERGPADVTTGPSAEYLAQAYRLLAEATLPPRAPALLVRDRELGAHAPAVMAIINRTDDSFYAPARYLSNSAALGAVSKAVDEGADIIDVGGVRAGVGPEVTTEEEIRRVVPFIEAVRAKFPDLIISVDTWRAEVARAAALAGVDLLNDTWAGFDPDLVQVAAEFNLALVCSHTGGNAPRTDPSKVSFPLPVGAPAILAESDGVVVDVIVTLLTAAERATLAGVNPRSILIDPTHDFGKRTQDSLALLANTGVLAQLGYPLLMALSRKDFVGETLDLPVDDRLDGTLAATAIAAFHGATLFRAHDVTATRRVADMVAAIRGDVAPLAPLRGL